MLPIYADFFYSSWFVFFFMPLTMCFVLVGLLKAYASIIIAIEGKANQQAKRDYTKPTKSAYRRPSALTAAEIAQAEAQHAAFKGGATSV